MAMKLYSRKQYGSYSVLVFSIDEQSISISEVCNIDNYALVCFKRTKINRNTNGKTTHHIKNIIGIRKHESAKDVAVTIKVYVMGLEEPAEFTCSESWTTNDIDTRPYKLSEHLFEVRVSLQVSKTEDPLKIKLHNDDQFTDFHLCAADGSVSFHKAVMAAHSDVLKAMLGGMPKDTEEIYIDLKGVTTHTLQHLKEFMYLGIVPQDELQLRHLIMLSQSYSMNDLETKCTMKLLHTITTENFLDILDFSRECNIPKLTFDILQFIPEEIVKSAYEMEVGKKHELNGKP